PSIFFLREDPRQSILVIFNWTEQPRSHTIKLADLGLPADHAFQASDALNEGEAVAVNGGTVRLENMARHSVRVIKLIDSAARDAYFTVQLTVDGLDGIAAHQSLTVKVAGTLVPAGDVLQNRRSVEPTDH